MSFFDTILQHISAARPKSVEEAWSLAGKAGAFAREFPTHVVFPIADRIVTGVLQAGAESGIGDEALSALNRLAGKYNLSSVPETLIEDLGRHKIAGVIAAVTLSIPGFHRLALHAEHWAHSHAREEAKDRAESHQVLDTRAGHQSKSDLQLPLEDHSKISFEKLTTFFDTMQERYPDLFGPARSAVRAYYEAKTTLLSTLTEHSNRTVQVMARTLLYSEHISRTLDVGRTYNPSVLLGKMIRAAAGVSEPSIEEIALRGASNGMIRQVRGAALLLGGLEAFFGLSTAYERLRHMMGRDSGVYEDTIQKRQDKVRRAQLRRWRRGGELAPRDDGEEDDGIAAQVREEALEFLSPSGTFGRIKDTIRHPLHHAATLFGLLTGLGVGAAQVFKEREKLWTATGFQWGHLWSDVLTKGEYHNARNLSGFSAYAAYGFLTGKTWSDKFAALGPLAATFLADKSANRLSRYLYEKPVVQESLALALEKGTGTLRDYFLLGGDDKYLGKEFLEKQVLGRLEHDARSLRDVISFRKSGAAFTPALEEEFERTANQISLLGQEILGPLAEIVLLPLFTGGLKRLGEFFDEKGAKGRARKRVKRKKRENEVRQEQAREEAAQAAPVSQGSAPASPTPKTKVSVHTHVNSVDAPVDLRTVQRGRETDERRGRKSRLQYAPAH